MTARLGSPLFRAFGLLEEVNRDWFAPRGLRLAVAAPGDSASETLFVLRAEGEPLPCPECSRDLLDDTARVCEVCDDRYERQAQPALEHEVFALEAAIVRRIKFDGSERDRVLTILRNDAEKVRALAALHGL